MLTSSPSSECHHPPHLHDNHHQISPRHDDVDHDLHHDDQDDDDDSVKSFGSVNSAMSCDTATAALKSGGGSIWGSRSLKYVVHCRHNQDVNPDDYLTPTQRAARRIRELKVNILFVLKAHNGFWLCAGMHNIIFWLKITFKLSF